MGSFASILSILILVFTKNDCFRLSSSLIPVHYDLTIATFLYEPETEYNFTGDVQIFLQCQNTTNEIHFHAKDLKISKNIIVVSLRTKTYLRIERVVKDNDVYKILLRDEMEKYKNYKLHVAFKGNLSEETGFHKRSYVDRSGVVHWMVLTNFQAIDARNVFPCFDEPKFKATFRITLGHHQNFTSISNMAVRKRSLMQDNWNWTWSEFDLTLPIPTYMVGFVIFDFSYSEMSIENVVFKIWARRDSIGKLSLIKHFVPQLLRHFETYFNLGYPLPKLDIVAIPDFQVACRDSWGLILYNEDSILSKNNRTTQSLREMIEITSFAIAHQWVGNLVSVRWWSDLWFYEGLTAYFSLQVGRLFCPEEEDRNEKDIAHLLEVFEKDSLSTSKQISPLVVNDEDIFEITSQNSLKTSFLFTMISNFLTDSVIQRAVSQCLRDALYKNADVNDFLRALDEEAIIQGVLSKDLNLKTVINSWTYQTGYPLITIKSRCEKGELHITQQKYPSGFYKNYKPCWWVPITYTTEYEHNFEATRPKLWLPCLNEVVVEERVCAQWLIANVQASGLYKVNYDAENWRRITKALVKDCSFVPEKNRVLLIENVFDFARIGYVSYEQAFDFVSYMEKEESYLPWETVLHKLNYVKLMLWRTSSYLTFQDFMRHFLKSILVKLQNYPGPYGFEGKSGNYLRTIITTAACDNLEPICIDDVKKLIKEWEKNPNILNAIAVEIRPTIYCTIIKQGREKEWYFFWDNYVKMNDSLQKSVIASALGCTTMTGLLERYLNWTIQNNSLIREQDVMRIFISVTNNVVGFDIVEEFFYKNFREISKRYETSFFVPTFILMLAKGMTTETERVELENFIRRNPDFIEKNDEEIVEALERIQMNIQWNGKHRSNLERILSLKTKKFKRDSDTEQPTNQTNSDFYRKLKTHDNTIAELSSCGDVVVSSRILIVNLLLQYWK